MNTITRQCYEFARARWTQKRHPLLTATVFFTLGKRHSTPGVLGHTQSGRTVRVSVVPALRLKALREECAFCDEKIDDSERHFVSPPEGKTVVHICERCVDDAQMTLAALTESVSLSASCGPTKKGTLKAVDQEGKRE